MSHPDFIVIGAGMAGVSVAYALQEHGRVVLLERELLPGHHTTGRSAAILLESHAEPVVGKLTRAARNFFEQPPEGLSEVPLVAPVPVLWVAREDQRASLRNTLENGLRVGAKLAEIPTQQAFALCPVLREDYVRATVIEHGALHIDVASVLQAFLRGFRMRGGALETKAQVTGISKQGDRWEVKAGGRVFKAGVVVNAAGAWCEEMGALAGAPPIGLRPLRRTVITFDPPVECDIHSWPCVIDADEDFYFKPEGRGQLLASPCDESPSLPCDAAPEDEDVARAADHVERATTLEIKHIRHRWAGLRSFVADRCPVVGMDPECPGFFWLAGQGGIGIMTAPACARAAAGLIVNGALPESLRALGLTEAQLSPARLRGPATPA